jgi:hypothetical protein
MRSSSALAPTLLVVLATGSAGAAVSPAVKSCESAVSSALNGCVAKVNATVRKCYRDTGAACSGKDDAKITGAIDAVAGKLASKCTSAAIAAAGYGANTNAAQLGSRVGEACRQQAASLVSRSFGGPQGAQLAGADAATKTCLDTAFKAAGKLQRGGFKTAGACIKKDHAGAPCDAAATDAKIAKLADKTRERITKKCAAVDATLGIEKPLGMSTGVYVDRAVGQARCLAATAWGDSGPLDLGCGPRPQVPVPPRGVWTQVVLDSATWGTKCGDGSDYAFWIRLAPAGKPLGKVSTDMQGGGVCVFEGDCKGVLDNAPDLFSALDEGEPTGGYLSTDSLVNPLSDRTMLFMPYCTQDVHIGGGTTSTFPSVTVRRFGGINVRTALDYLRDVLWAAQNSDESGGWQPGALEVFFAGESAGAFGVQFNYHWALDDLGWSQTTAAPDSALSLDNGQVLGVASLGALVKGTANPYGWNVAPMLPTYCQAGNCALGPVIQSATSPRLTGPFQQILNISNQVDSTQVSTTYFSTTPAWVNALRASYCAQRGKQGIHYFLPGEDTSIHTMLRDDPRYTGLSADGVDVRDYVAAAMSSPASVVDRVDEGDDIETTYPGVNPFPCSVGSPSGAFLN